MGPPKYHPIEPSFNYIFNMFFDAFLDTFLDQFWGGFWPPFWTPFWGLRDLFWKSFWEVPKAVFEHPSTTFDSFYMAKKSIKKWGSKTEKNSFLVAQNGAFLASFLEHFWKCFYN